MEHLLRQISFLSLKILKKTNDRQKKNDLSLFP